MWRWTFALSEYCICPSAPTSLNIGQFLPQGSMGTVQEWLLVYAHSLQHVAEAAHERSWHSNRDNYTPQVSLLVDVFLEVTDVRLNEADIVDCWNASKGDVLQQCDTGCFAEVVSYLDELVTRAPTRDTWGTLVFPMST